MCSVLFESAGIELQQLVRYSKFGFSPQTLQILTTHITQEHGCSMMFLDVSPQYFGAKILCFSTFSSLRIRCSSASGLNTLGAANVVAGPATFVHADYCKVSSIFCTYMS